MKNTRNKTVFKLIISLCLLLYIFTRIDLNVLRELSFLTGGYLVICLIITLSSLLLMSFRWKILLKKYTSCKCLLSELFNFYLIGMFFNIFLPGAIGGDITRVYNASKKYDITVKKSTLFVFIERIVGLVSVIIIFCLGSLIISDYYEMINYDRSLLFLIIVIIVTAIVSLKTYLEKKIDIDYKLITIIFLLSILGQFGDILIVRLFCYNFSLPVTIYHIMVIMPLVYISSIIPISFGGLGVREGTMAVLFSFIGIDSSIAVMISLLLYFVKVGVGAIGGVIYGTLK
ncbi:lysylphosphatidylglycerol synthase transmembrane domain-containing protein [Methanosarcina sp. WWM596]|uniref:lysylphosphatidylglycerol synthase transmembrane domain-containing protein n=1 Tax=Methanosarcina sp. WWM596 TaxID=1434103 RepID=UPI00061556AD|nr:lysylphosphatidylglycerol synthase transmembrane domain-containing protein [Methanosarcina sp. WWM596]AKB18845.1 hypothetical protein MSWHS_1982 [Methanosarcina sp. WWM596]